MIMIKKIFPILLILLAFCSCAKEEISFENANVKIEVKSYGGGATVADVIKIGCEDKNNGNSFSRSIKASGDLAGIVLDKENIIDEENLYSIVFVGSGRRTIKIDFENQRIYDHLAEKKVDTTNQQYWKDQEVLFEYK
jgi:hypothetical protein